MLSLHETYRNIKNPDLNREGQEIFFAQRPKDERVH